MTFLMEMLRLAVFISETTLDLRLLKRDGNLAVFSGLSRECRTFFHMSIFHFSAITFTPPTPFTPDYILG